MSIRTPLARARGLGAASEGADHFWKKTVTSVALVPLAVWFIWSLIGLAWKPYEAAIDFVAKPQNTIFLLLFITVGFAHFRMGLHSVIDDYIHDRAYKIVALILNDFFCVVMGMICVLSVLKVFILAIPA